MRRSLGWWGGGDPDCGLGDVGGDVGDVGIERRGGVTAGDAGLGLGLALGGRPVGIGVAP
jgi:hypothetical protein